jgi:phosphatidylglycerophosphatase A
MWFPKITATVFGIGYCKGGGTLAAIACCICWYFGLRDVTPNWYAGVATLLIIAVGIWAGNRVEPLWGKDHGRVVIDEVAGMAVTLLLVPATIKYIIAGLILFRFFDIVKPLYIRRLEKLPGGWGVMFDDILAGVYSNIVLTVAVMIFHF